MLEVQSNGTITEMSMTVMNGDYVPTGTTGNFYPSDTYYWPYQTMWQSYPVYVCSDKTAKAIEVLKALQAEKILKCDSVPRFIALVEKIAQIL